MSTEAFTVKGVGPVAGENFSQDASLIKARLSVAPELRTVNGCAPGFAPPWTAVKLRLAGIAESAGGSAGGTCGAGCAALIVNVPLSLLSLRPASSSAVTRITAGALARSAGSTLAGTVQSNFISAPSSVIWTNDPPSI